MNTISIMIGVLLEITREGMNLKLQCTGDFANQETNRSFF